MRTAFRVIVGLIVLTGIALLLVDRSRYGDEAGRELGQPERDRQAVEAAIALEARARRNLAEHPDGRHCLHPASGTHAGVIAFTQARLHEPDSFAHVATELAPVNLTGQHLLKLTYRARAESGETYDRTETFVVQNSDCSFER